MQFEISDEEISKRYWTNILKSVKRFFKGIWLSWLLFCLSISAGYFVKDGNFLGLFTFQVNPDTKISTIAGLNWIRIGIITGLSLGIATLNYVIESNKKKKEKNEEIERIKTEFEKVRTELDAQYDYAFKFANYCIFNLHDVIGKEKPDTISYIETLLTNMAQVSIFILDANKIENNSLITASLMVKRPVDEIDLLKCKLEIAAFGPKGRPGRRMRKLPFYRNQEDKENDNPLPGAPTAFCKKETVYIEDTTNSVYGGLFESKEYKSFLSIPITENETDGGDVFAVINIDSPYINQFQDLEFFSQKISPALRPFIALIKVLHKINQI